MAVTHLAVNAVPYLKTKRLRLTVALVHARRGVETGKKCIARVLKSRLKSLNSV